MTTTAASAMPSAPGAHRADDPEGSLPPGCDLDEAMFAFGAIAGSVTKLHEEEHLSPEDLAFASLYFAIRALVDVYGLDRAIEIARKAVAGMPENCVDRPGEPPFDSARVLPRYVPA